MKPWSKAHGLNWAKIIKFKMTLLGLIFVRMHILGLVSKPHLNEGIMKAILFCRIYNKSITELKIHLGPGDAAEYNK